MSSLSKYGWMNVTCCAVLCGAVLCCAVLCCAVVVSVSLLSFFFPRLSKFSSLDGILEEVAVKVHNSHLVHGFLYELRGQKSMKYVCAAVRCSCSLLNVSTPLCCAVLCCGVVWCAAVLCCGVLRCGVLWCGLLCCAVLCCAVLWCAVLCCGVLCCAVVWCGVLCSAATTTA